MLAVVTNVNIKAEMVLPFRSWAEKPSSANMRMALDSSMATTVEVDMPKDDDECPESVAALICGSNIGGPFDILDYRSRPVR